MTEPIEAALEKLDALPDELGKVTDLLADTGYYSAANVRACTKGDVQPWLAMARDCHHPPVFDRFAPDTRMPETDDPVIVMEHQLDNRGGACAVRADKTDG